MSTPNRPVWDATFYLDAPADEVEQRAATLNAVPGILAAALLYSPGRRVVVVKGQVPADSLIAAMEAFAADVRRALGMEEVDMFQTEIRPAARPPR
jgi:hypothetical protein